MHFEVGHYKVKTKSHVKFKKGTGCERNLSGV